MRSVGRFGASHSGLVEWLLQRLTAIYIGLFTIYFLVKIAGGGFADFTSWKMWFDQDLVRWSWLAFYAGLLLHAWIGMRSVFLDYIKSFALRLVLTFSFGLLFLFSALWFLEIIYLRGVS